jgi:hypothetical protein
MRLSKTYNNAQRRLQNIVLVSCSRHETHVPSTPSGHDQANTNYTVLTCSSVENGDRKPNPMGTLRRPRTPTYRLPSPRHRVHILRPVL